MIRYFKAWKKWAKYNDNSKIYKILVLLNLRHSPSFRCQRRFNKW